MPEDATADMRAVAADFERRLRERLADGEKRPVPYAYGYAAERLNWWMSERKDKTRVRRAIHRLLAAKVLAEDEPLPPRDGLPYGTKTYLPYVRRCSECNQPHRPPEPDDRYAENECWFCGGVDTQR